MVNEVLPENRTVAKALEMGLLVSPEEIGDDKAEAAQARVQGAGCA